MGASPSYDLDPKDPSSCKKKKKKPNDPVVLMVVGHGAAFSYSKIKIVISRAFKK